MAFHIYSAINNVVSVQTDMQSTFEVVGQGQAHELLVNLNFAKVHVAGDGITQAPTFTGASGLRFEVQLRNNNVTIQPV